MNFLSSPLALKEPKPVTLNPSNQIIPTKQHHIKPIFRSKVKWRCLTPSDITYINKYKPKMLSSIELKRLRCQCLNDFRNLCRALADTKRISSIIITDPNYYDECLTKFRHFIRITNRWKKLSLKYSGDQESSANKEKLKSVTRLRRCKDLSSLKIYFDCHLKTQNKILKCLSQQLQGLPKLKNLNIDVSGCYSNGDSDEEDEDEAEDEDEDESDGANSSILKFKFPRSLSFLHLAFHEEGSINTQILPIFSSNIQRCHILNKVALDFKNIYYQMEPPETQVWRSLAEKMSPLKTLRIMKTLHSHEFEANKAYLDSFQHLKALENLTLDFYFSLSEQNNQILSPIFFNHLASFTSLKYLSLTFACRNDHPGFLNFFTLKLFSQLEQLRLNLPFCCNMENTFFQYLALAFPSLYRLQNFELILPNSNVTHEGIIPLSSSFSHLPQLKNLSLNFKNISIDHKIIEAVSNHLAHLNLTSLKLILGEQPEKPKSFLQKLSALWQSEKRLTSLFSALCGLNSLESLSLNLSGFDICTKEFKHFSLVLKELKHLKLLSLELPQFDSGNNFEGLRRFLSGLKELQKLNLLHLAFRGAKLCNKEVEIVALNIRDCSRHLEDLKLDFKHTERLGNVVLNYLGTGLQSLTSLRSLSLVIEKQKVFQKEAVTGLLKSLMTLKGLESVILEFRSSALHRELRTSLMQMEYQQNLRRLTNFIFQDVAWI